MDLPILKYIDIVLGLAVVILLICTIVAAVAQLLLSVTFSRARYLRDGLEDLICQLDPDSLTADAHYIAERCLRHPLVGRNNTLFGKLACDLRNWFRGQGKKPRQPLPRLNPPDVLERDELVLMLLEWAANDGPLAHQDGQIENTTVQGGTDALAPIRQTLGTAVLKLLLQDPVKQQITANPFPEAESEKLNEVREILGAEILKQLPDKHLKAIVAARTAGSTLADVRERLKTALLKNGVADPALAACDIRAKIVSLENSNPAQASAISRSLAIASAAPSDFVGKIHVWFDNTMARVSNQYGLLAQVWAAILAFAVVFSCQFDALDLIKRLSQDDKLRADLVQQAKDQSARIDTVNQKVAEAGEPNPAQRNELNDATVQRQQISASLAVLRDPNRAILPNYLLWEQVAQGGVCIQKPEKVAGLQTGTVKVDADSRDFQFTGSSTPLVDLAVALRSSGAPVAIYSVDYRGQDCLKLVARDRVTKKIVVSIPGLAVDTVTYWNTWRDYDWDGSRSRLPGMLLGAILVSLGTPFWFDLLKKLLGLRSLLAAKDDADRQQRQSQHAVPPAPVSGGGSGGAGPAGGMDERGDLAATGGAG